MATKKMHIVGVKTKRAKKSKGKINKKRQTFKINKYIRAKRRSNKNLILSRIQKNQLIGGGESDNKDGKKYKAAVEYDRLATEKYNRELKANPRAFDNETQGKAMIIARYAETEKKNDDLQRLVRTEAAREAVREEAEEAAMKAFKEADHMETHEDDVYEAAAYAQAALHLGDGMDEAAKEKRRAYNDVYTETYMRAVRAATEATEAARPIMGPDGILRFGGKRKRRRTRRKKIKQEKEH